MTQFGEVLAELRKDRSLTQKQLAEEIHVSTSTISNYEIGAHYPDIEKLIELANYFNVTTDYLLGRCAVDYSPDVFQDRISAGMSIGEMIDLVKGLTVERKEALVIILRDMWNNRR